MNGRPAIEHEPGTSRSERAEWLRSWWPEIVIAVLVAVLALPTLISSGPIYGLIDLVSIGCVGASAVAFRRAPGWALVLVWAALAVRSYMFIVLGGALIAFVDVVVFITAFGMARYGSRTVVALSGLSIPLVVGLALVGSAIIGGYGFGYGTPFLGDLPLGAVDLNVTEAPIILLVLLGIPWLIGLVMRSASSASDSEQAAVVARTGEQQAHAERDQAEIERAQAQEIAHLRADQTRMAREVHDVVGHSLSVILAQAESAQFLPQDSLDAHRRVLANVANTARQSLQDVRNVLGATREGAKAAAQSVGGMDSLIEGIRSSGYEVDSVTIGIPRALPPERDAVAFRVLQEMLTNALKHGSRHEPITVERHWEGDLRMEVRNACADPNSTPPLGTDDASGPATEGTGVESMQRRLQSVGGFLDVRRRAATDGSGRQTFTATAWMPLQS